MISFVIKFNGVFYSSKRQLWPMSPPQIHLSSYITGGLKRLYHHLRSECLNVPIYGK